MTRRQVVLLVAVAGAVTLLLFGVNDLLHRKPGRVPGPTRTATTTATPSVSSTPTVRLTPTGPAPSVTRPVTDQRPSVGVSGRPERSQARSEARAPHSATRTATRTAPARPGPTRTVPAPRTGICAVLDVCALLGG